MDIFYILYVKGQMNTQEKKRLYRGTKANIKSNSPIESKADIRKLMDESQDPHAEEFADQLEWFSNNPRFATAVIMARTLVDVCCGDTTLKEIQNKSVVPKVIYFELSDSDQDQIYVIKDKRIHPFQSKLTSEMIVQTLQGNR